MMYALRNREFEWKKLITFGRRHIQTQNNPNMYLHHGRREVAIASRNSQLATTGKLPHET